MHKFIIKNTGDSKLIINFEQGSFVLKMNESFYYESENEDLLPQLKKEYTNGNIDCFRIIIPKFEQTKSGSWMKEGF